MVEPPAPGLALPAFWEHLPFSISMPSGPEDSADLRAEVWPPEMQGRCGGGRREETGADGMSIRP